MQEQQAEAVRIAAERKRMQQEQAVATAQFQAEQKKRNKEEQLRVKRMQQVCSSCTATLGLLGSYLWKYIKRCRCLGCLVFGNEPFSHCHVI